MAVRHNSKLADNEPAWSDVDKTELPEQAFVWQARDFDPEKKSTWSYPHHFVRGGILYLHRGGLGAALAAARGARSGKRAEQAVFDHLGAHYKAIGEPLSGKGVDEYYKAMQDRLDTLLDADDGRANN